MDVAFLYLVLNFTAALALPLALVATAPFSNYPAPTAPPEVEQKEVKVAKREVEPPKEIKLLCIGCSPNEQTATDFLYNRGITDKHAVATVLGNIKQESKFVPNICEGGARVSYYGCRSGGYGLIQWTSSNRYHGLGQFASRYGGDPSSLHTQLNYMVNEVQWKNAESVFKRGGLSINQYMNAAHSWLGWGIHGARTNYAWSYVGRLEYTEV